MQHHHLRRTRAVCAYTVLIGVFLISSAAHGGGVLFVDDDASPGGDGASWNTAYRFLQDALTDASGGGTSEVRVAQGIYKPDRDEANPDGTGDREASFHLLNSVALMGGYAGLGAKDPDARDIELYETILSGDLLGNDGPDFENTGENSFHVANGTGTDGTAVMDGLTILAGATNLGGGEHIRGAGIINDPGSPTIANCSFLHNLARAGGGIYNHNGSNPPISFCRFIGNVAEDGGGGAILNQGDSNPTITDSLFEDNFAALGGGAIMNFEGSSPTIEDCMFKTNATSQGGGAIRNEAQSSPTLENCVFVGNAAGIVGGAMYQASASSPMVMNCSFTENQADRWGGAVWSDSSGPSFFSCEFTNNTAFIFDGGALGIGSDATQVVNCTFEANFAGDFGGAIFTDNFSPTIVDCDFVFNTAGEHGGGMFISDGSPSVLSCTFTANAAKRGAALYNDNADSLVVLCQIAANEAVFSGGAIYNNSTSFPIFLNCLIASNSAGGNGGAMVSRNDSAPLVANCTISNNSALKSGGALYNYQDGITVVTNSILWGNEPNEIEDNRVVSVVMFSDVEGGWSGKGSGNIDADPLFVDPENGDYRLASGSPCIDAADNAAVLKGIVTDLDGNPRFIEDPNTPDTGLGDCPIVDMGSYEFQEGTADCCPWDLDGSGDVGVKDLLMLLGTWGPCPPNGDCLADFDDSGDVGVKDLLVLLGAWGQCP